MTTRFTKEVLQLDYGLGEEALQPLISIVLLRTLIIKLSEILRRLSEVDMIILNLSLMGMLFNSCYFNEGVSAIFAVLQDLSYQESTLLSLSGICRNEEPA